MCGPRPIGRPGSMPTPEQLRELELQAELKRALVGNALAACSLVALVILLVVFFIRST